MKCVNPACGKNIATPLELFNGVLTCPFCKEELSVIRDFKITEKNNDLFNLSELYYFKYLTMAKKEKGQTGKFIKENELLLKRAISVCKESAYLGHPLAIFKMGGYYESYFEESLSEADKKRVAFEYYASLCYSTATSVEKSEGIIGFTSDEFADLKRQAAKRLYNIVVTSSRELGAFKKYNKEFNIDKITSIYGAMEIDHTASSGSGENPADQLRKLFITSSNKKKRAPLFGIYKLDGEKLKELFTGDKEKAKIIFRTIQKGLEVRYIESKNGRVDEIDGYFTKMSNAQSTLNNLEEVGDTKEYYLYFFNTGGKHAFLSGGQMSRIKKLLENNHFEQIKRLINGGAENYTFFDDDIIMFLKGKNYEGAIDSLMDYICEEN